MESEQKRDLEYRLRREGGLSREKSKIAVAVVSKWFEEKQRNTPEEKPAEEGKRR